jgi:glycosyltransferase
MRVAFVMWPAAAHLYPFVPLAWALKAAGHEVCVISHAPIAEATASMGLTPVSWCDPDSMPVPMGPGRPYPEERAELARVTEAMAFGPDDPDREHWDVFTQFYLPAMWDFIPYKADPATPMPAMDGLVDFTRTWKPDLVLWDPCIPGAAVAARVSGAVQARWWTAPDVFCRSIDRFTEVTGANTGPAVDNPLAETVRPLADRYGVEVDTELLFGQWTVNQQPVAVGPRTSAHTLPVRWIPHARQEVMPDWMYPVPERPRVLVSLGLSERMFMEGGWTHIPYLLDALGGLDVEVIATLNKTQLGAVTTIPDNVRVFDFVPIDQLMPTCSLLIHHGGMGTVMPAVAHRVPQLVLDFVGNQISATALGGRMGRSRYSLGPALSRYVTETGAGLILDVSKPNVDEMRGQISRVLTEPSFRDGVTKMYDELVATPSPVELVPILERMVARHR